MKFLWILLISQIVRAEEGCYCGLRKDNFKMQCTSNFNNSEIERDANIECKLLMDGKTLSIYPKKPEHVYELADKAFSDLKLEKGIKLLIGINATSNPLNSNHFLGSDAITDISAQQSDLSLTGCALASSSNLFRLTIDCNTDFVDNYLSFGSSFQYLRLINCRGVEKQFICQRCTNGDDVTVIHIRDGPKSEKHYIRIDAKEKPKGGLIKSLTACSERICSDKDLCRHEKLHDASIDAFNLPNYIEEKSGGYDVVPEGESRTYDYSLTRKIEIFWLWVALSVFAFITLLISIAFIVRKIIVTKPNKKKPAINKEMISSPEYA